MASRLVLAPCWRRNLGILWLGQFLVTAGLTVVVPLLPFYLEELGTTDPAANRLWSGLALAAPAIPLMLAAPAWGWLGDRYGRKWMVVRALAGIALSVVMMGLVRTPLAFVICRLLQGALGGVDDAAAAFAGGQVPAAARGKAMGYLQTSTAAGALAGPLLGGLLSRQWGFAPLILATGLLIGAAGLVAALGLRELPTLAQARASGPTLGAGIRGILGEAQARAYLLAGLWIQIGAYGIVASFALHVRDLLPNPHDAGAWVGLLQAVTWSATLVGAGWWGRRNDRVPLERNVVLAACGCGLSILLQPLVAHVGWLLPLRAVQGFCLSALGQAIYLRASRTASSAQQGLHIGVANSFLTSGQVLGALAGALVAGLAGTAGTFVVMSSCFGLSALVVWRMTRRAQQRKATGMLQKGEVISS